MPGDDEQFERYLSEFQPKRPQALPATPARTLPWLWRAAAAVLVIGLGTTIFVLRRANVAKQAQFNTRSAAGVRSTETELPDRSFFRLTRLAAEDPQEFDAELWEASRRILPNFRSKDSTLRVLAKE